MALALAAFRLIVRRMPRETLYVKPTVINVAAPVANKICSIMFYVDLEKVKLTRRNH